MFGEVDAWGIDEDDLRLGQGKDTSQATPGGLGFRGDDGDLLPHEGVDEGGLAYVRLPQDGYETRTVVFWQFFRYEKVQFGLSRVNLGLFLIIHEA
jgi:hypothetical protein